MQALGKQSKSRGRAMALGAWALAAALWLLAGCGQYGTLDPGPNPAKVRVLLSLQEDRNWLDPWDLAQPYTRWDWDLYLVQEDGRLIALRTARGQSLKAILGHKLEQDVVFLVPPGQRRLRVIVHGYVEVQDGRYYRPVDVAYLNQDFQVNLAPGQEITLRPSAQDRVK
ncbi:MAG: hypothetical protein AB1814_15795 [Thermodesulfobacteriota bacterium]